MGYRPSIYIDNKFIFEFGKFYGYVDHDDLKSIKWLNEHGKIEYDGLNEPGDVFFGGYGPRIEFTADEFREFWDLYIQDINEHDFSHDGIKYDKPYDPEYTWDAWGGDGQHKTFKEAVYDTDDEKVIVWG